MCPTDLMVSDGEGQSGSRNRSHLSFGGEGQMQRGLNSAPSASAQAAELWKDVEALAEEHNITTIAGNSELFEDVKQQRVSQIWACVRLCKVSYGIIVYHSPMPLRAIAFSCWCFLKLACPKVSPQMNWHESMDAWYSEPMMFPICTAKGSAARRHFDVTSKHSS